VAGRQGQEWGWTTPALVGEDGGLIAGHARILAARQLGIGEIPVMVAAGWSEAQKRAYVRSLFEQLRFE
jgi:ParB-like chromosome segregation protein Spo0J